MKLASNDVPAGLFDNPQPYESCLRFCSGIYLIRVGEKFYVGSTRRLGHRVSHHRAALDRGDHYIESLQAAYREGREFRAFLLLEVPKKFDDTDEEHIERLEWREQQAINLLFDDPDCVNQKRHVGSGFTGETSKKMSEAKTGYRNPKARACTLQFKGVVHHFASGQDAARAFGVHQQLMDQWLKGLAAWPGTGVRKTRKPELIGLTGSYD